MTCAARLAAGIASRSSYAASRRVRAASWAALVACAYALARAFMPAGLPAGILLQGVVLGGLSSLVAMGLVLLYRAFRIVNFAQAAVGALGASLAVALSEGPRWPFAACAASGIALSLVAGALTESLLHWRFDRAPRLVLIVVTIGLLQVFGAVQVAVPSLVGSPSSVAPSLELPFSLTFLVAPVTFTSDAVVSLAAVPVIGAALWWFLWRTETGRVLSGVSDSREQALLLCLPVRRSARAAWLIAAALSAIGAILSAPILQSVPGTASSAVDLLAPLAAAVLARFRSLSAAVAWSFVIGVVQQAVFWSFHSSTYADLTLFALIAAGLLCQQGSPRGDDADTGFGTWAAVSEVRRIPRRLACLGEVRAARVVGLVVALGLAVGVPFRLSDAQTGPMAVAAIYAMIAVSLVVLTGWSGQVSLGQFAFAGIGALVTGALLANAHVDFFAALLISATAGAVVACLIGIPALRLSGIQLSVVTLAFAVIVSEWLLSPEYFPSLNPLELARPVLFGKLSLTSSVTFYEVCLGALLLALLAARNFRRSRTGRAVVAVRDSPKDAAAFGIEPWRQRLTAFAFAGALAGMAGGLYVVSVGGTGYGGIDPTLSITVFSMAVVGGIGSLTGALIGAAYVWSVVTFLPVGWSLLASGAGLLVLVAFLPEGVAGLVFRARDLLLRRLALRRNVTMTWGHPRSAAVAQSAVPPVAPSGAQSAVPRSAGPRSAGRVGMSEPVVSQDAAPEASRASILTLEGLDVCLGAQHVLCDVSLTVRRGGATALVGTNGAGKSTLLRTVAGLVRPREGVIRLNESDISDWGPGARVGAGLVTIPQGRGVFASLTVAENLRLAGWTMRARHRDPDALARSEGEVDELFPFLRERRDVPAGQLSGGERHMLSLGRALVCRPELLLIDELSLGLAPSVLGELIAALRVLLDRGVSLLVVDQSVSVAASICEEAVFLERGRVGFRGPAKDLRDRSDIVRSVFLGDAALEGVATQPSGTDREKEPLCAPAGDGEPTADVLVTTDLSKRFGGVTALGGVNLALRAGEVVGLIGANGAGKTTLVDVCSGYERPDTGSVILYGDDVTAWSAGRRARKALGRTFQDTWLFPSMTVEEVVAVARDRHLEIRDPALCVLWTAAAASSERRVAAEVAELLDVLCLSDMSESLISELSTGVRRLVALACVLAFEPRVLLLDEPFSGLAESEAHRLVPLLLELRSRTSSSFVVIDHDLRLVGAVSDRLAYLEAGSVGIEGRPDDVLSDPRVLASYAGSRSS